MESRRFYWLFFDEDGEVDGRIYDVGNSGQFFLHKRDHNRPLDVDQVPLLVAGRFALHRHLQTPNAVVLLLRLQPRVDGF